MIYRGRVRNGVITLSAKVKLPEGTKVIVQPVVPAGKRPDVRKRSRSLAERLASVIGEAQGLPADGAKNIDHYLYGLPKRR